MMKAARSGHNPGKSVYVILQFGIIDHRCLTPKAKNASVHRGLKIIHLTNCVHSILKHRDVPSNQTDWKASEQVKTNEEKSISADRSGRSKNNN